MTVIDLDLAREERTPGPDARTMRAAVQDMYGPPEVLRVVDLSRPEPGRDAVLVRVHASSVTAADWRIRGAEFPTGFRTVGRLMFGLRRPRQRVTGREFAGSVVGLGPNARGFHLGQCVHGIVDGGAAAQFVTVRCDGPVAPMPEGLTFREAAALPFGAMCALWFLRDAARLARGERIAILGAAGGVGVYAVQIAKALGGRVTAVCGHRNLDLVRELGADEALNYRAVPFPPPGGVFDVVFDAVGATTFARCRPALAAGARFVPLEFGPREIAQALRTRWRRGPKVLVAVSPDTHELLIETDAMVREGTLRPVIDRSYPLDEIAEAHRYVQSRRRSGSVVIDV